MEKSKEKGSHKMIQSHNTTFAVPLRRLKVVSWGTAYRVSGTAAAAMYGLSVAVRGER